jgi:hypothetical protein
MTGHRRGCGVIAGDGNNVRAQGGDHRNIGIDFFNDFNFLLVLVVFAAGIGIFYVHEEIIIVAVHFFQSLKLCLDILGDRMQFRANQPGDAAIHGMTVKITDSFEAEPGSNPVQYITNRLPSSLDGADVLNYRGKY